MEFHRLTRRISEFEIDDFLSFPPPPPPPSHESHTRKIWLLLLCLIGVAALVFTILKRRYSNSNRTQIRTNPETQAPDVGGDGDGQREFLDENHGPVVDHPIWYIRTVGLPQSIIDSIAVFKFKKDDGLTEETDCTICLSKFLEEDTLRLLPKCSHAFHIPCIDTWLSSHQNCPLCRAPVVCNATNDAQTSHPEPNSDQLQETQVENSEDSDDEMRSHEQVIRTENFGGLTRDVSVDESNTKNPLRIRVLSDIGDHRLVVEEELQPLRRSVSLDASSALVIYLAVSSNAHEGSSSGQLAQANKSSSKKLFNGATISRLMKSASFGYSLQKRPASMKRSFSSFRRVSSRRHYRSQDSILPL